MADSIIMERVADAAAECFYAELVKTEDLGAFEALVAAAKGAGGACGKIAELAAYAANHASEIRPPAHELGTIEGTNGPHRCRKAQRPGQVVVAQGRGDDMSHQVRAGNGMAARCAGRIPVVHRKAGECGRVGCGEAGQTHARDVGKGLGAAASGAAAGEVRDDIPISKELGSCYR